MRWSTLAAVLLLAPLAVSPQTSAEPTTEDAGYFPHLVAVGISCGKEDHSLIPQDPADPSEDDPVGWIFSGEPECALGDAANELRERNGQDRIQWGFGSVGFRYSGEDTGTLATARTTDAVFGADAGYLRLFARSHEEENAGVEGCGAQSMILPQPASPWDPIAAWGIWWVTIPEVGVDDDLTVCFATTGILHGTWGA